MSFGVSISACNLNPGNGFVNDSDLEFYIGSESSVELFRAFDSAWKNLDYKLMKTMIADSVSFEFHDGKMANNSDEFIEIIKKDVAKAILDGNSYTWTTDYAFSVDLTPSKKGEWVNAGFQGSDGFYMEWYQIEDGKLIAWSQAKRDSPTEKQ